MFKCLNNIVPEYNSDSFTFLSDIHQHFTRNSTNGGFLIPKPRTELYKQSLYFAGPSVWNNLHPALRMEQTLQSFKYKYKQIYKNINNNSNIG